MRQDIAHQPLDTFLDIVIRLGAGLIPSYESMLFAEAIEFLLVDTCVGEIALVCEENHGERGAVREGDLVVNLTLPLQKKRIERVREDG